MLKIRNHSNKCEIQNCLYQSCFVSAVSITKGYAKASVKWQNVDWMSFEDPQKLFAIYPAKHYLELYYQNHNALKIAVNIFFRKCGLTLNFIIYQDCPRYTPELKVQNNHCVECIVICLFKQKWHSNVYHEKN